MVYMYTGQKIGTTGQNIENLAYQRSEVLISNKFWTRFWKNQYNIFHTLKITRKKIKALLFQFSHFQHLFTFWISSLNSTGVTLTPFCQQTYHPEENDMWNICKIRDSKWLTCIITFDNSGFSLRVLYCVVDAGHGIVRSLGDCRPALLKGPKYQMVKTQTEPH